MKSLYYHSNKHLNRSGLESFNNQEPGDVALTFAVGMISFDFCRNLPSLDVNRTIANKERQKELLALGVNGPYSTINNLRILRFIFQS